jgi:hypothetical protein
MAPSFYLCTENRNGWNTCWLSSPHAKMEYEVAYVPYHRTGNKESYSLRIMNSNFGSQGRPKSVSAGKDLSFLGFSFCAARG